MHEDKQKILDRLLETLVLTRAGWNLMDLEYKRESGFETVTAVFANGHKKRINVSCDSGIALIRDVCRHI